MPSTIVGNPLLSGGQLLISGVFWSGSVRPVGGVQLVLDPSSSGNVYVGLSGSVTLTSGGMFLSGGGVNDGVLMAPGAAYYIPKSALPYSGAVNVYVRHDAACSGQARLYYEIF